jgi:hypothetical protein
MALSGIVALFFTGICHAHYSLYSVAPQAQITLRRFFEVAAFLCETFVFAYLGLQARHLSPFCFPCPSHVSHGPCGCLPRPADKSSIPDHPQDRCSCLFHLPGMLPFSLSVALGSYAFHSDLSLAGGFAPPVPSLLPHQPIPVISYPFLGKGSQGRLGSAIVP